MITSFLITLVLMLITDFCWAFSIRRIKDGNAFKSAMWNALLMLTSGFVTISYVTNPWMIIPVVIGAFIGTFLGVWLDAKTKKNT